MTAAENLTRAEVAERSILIDVSSYDVELDVTTDGPTFASTTRVLFTSRTPGASTWIDLIAPAVREIELNGRSLDVADVFDGSRITLDDLQSDNDLRVVADAAYMHTGEGLHRFTDPVDKETYLYTQFETADSRRVYASFEQPDLKATFALTISAPSHWQVLSNSPTPDPEPLTSSTAKWTFAPTPRMSTYITAIVAGPYACFEDSYDGPHGTYPLRVFCRSSLAPHMDADEILTVTKQGFEYFERQFGVPYPFGKYDQIFVPDFNAGAMENAACVTILEDYVFRSRVTDAAYDTRANTILHELAHMWFGNLVTMTWWDDLWLNESFAEWAAHWASANATRYVDAWTTFANQRKAWAYRQDQLPSTHPIAADMVDLDAVRVNFDGITYAKGASALRQLVAWVGEKEFLAGLNNYFAKHAWGNTQLSDLLVELEATSGRDLSGWTREWLQTSGVNMLRPIVEINADGSYASVTIEQEPPALPEGVAPTLRSHRVGLGLYDVTDAGLTRTRQLEIDVVGARTPVPALVGEPAPALLLVNDGDLTFAKVRLDESSWRTATKEIGTLVDPLARALIWSAVWDMTRDAEVATSDFLELVLSGIERETDVGVVQGVLRQLRTAIDVYAAPEHRPDYVRELALKVNALGYSAEPGSDHQLAFTRAAVAAASLPHELDWVEQLLDGEVVREGLAVDTDLRWFLLQRLVVMGRRDLDSIENELLIDDTAMGRRHAAVARASRPSAAAKELAWSDIVDRTDLPNSTLESTIIGFVQPDQLDELRPYRERYFEDLPKVWADHTTEMAQNIAVGLYPTLFVDDETVRLSDEFLARPDLNTALRRLVSEGRDGVLRALRARAKDASH